MFITCSFRSDGSGRAYTYACDLDDTIEPGSRVVVIGPEGSEKIVTVVDVDVPEPAFDCKSVVRVHVNETEEQEG
jgi:hypothetical protein